MKFDWLSEDLFNNKNSNIVAKPTIPKKKIGTHISKTQLLRTDNTYIHSYSKYRKMLKIRKLDYYTFIECRINDFSITEWIWNIYSLMYFLFYSFNCYKSEKSGLWSNTKWILNWW